MCHELLCCFRGNDYDHERRDDPKDNRSWDVKPPSTVNRNYNSANPDANDDTKKPPSPFPQGKPNEMTLPDDQIMKPVGAVEENNKYTQKKSSEPEEVSKKNIESRVQSADKKDQISAKNVLPVPGKNFTANEEVPRKPAAFIYDK